MSSIDATTMSRVYERMKAAWGILRKAQGDPMLDIVREHVVGAVPSRGIRGTIHNDGLADVECTAATLSIEEVIQHNLSADKSHRKFVVYSLSGGFTVRLTDKIRFADAMHDIKAVSPVEPSGRVEIIAEIAREKTSVEDY